MGLLLNFPLPSHLLSVMKVKSHSGLKMGGRSGRTLSLNAWLILHCWFSPVLELGGICQNQCGTGRPCSVDSVSMVCPFTALSSSLPEPWVSVSLPVWQSVPSGDDWCRGRKTGRCLHWGDQARTRKSVTAWWSLGSLSLAFVRQLPVSWEISLATAWASALQPQHVHFS